MDDFLCSGLGSNLRWLTKELKKEFEIKTSTIGPENHEDKELTFLGRTVRWKEDGIELEGDPKHARLLLKEWGMQDAKAVNTPGTIEEKRENDNEEQQEKIVGTRAKDYRRAAARLNYMALDRIDLGFASKECSRGMATPTEGDVQKLKRVLRYLVANQRACNKYSWQEPQRLISIYTDSDWAGCVKTRKSTSGGVVMLGCHLLSHWSSTQSTVAISVAEAELNALVKGAAEGIGQFNMSKDLGYDKYVEIFIDSNSAKGIASRKGCGKLKHLEAKQLWIQDVVEKKEVKVTKIPRAINVADALTHHWTGPEGKCHFPKTGWKQVLDA